MWMNLLVLNNFLDHFLFISQDRGFGVLGECLNNLYTMRTYLKGQYNKNKRQRKEPTKLVPISFVELKIKREKNEYVSLKALLTQVPVKQQLTTQLLDI